MQTTMKAMLATIKAKMKVVLGLTLCAGLCFSSASAQIQEPEIPGGHFYAFDAAGPWIDISPQWLADSCPTQASFRPGSPNMLFVGTCLEGLCYSSNLGKTWHREYTDFYVGEGIPSTWVRDVLFWEENPMIGVAGTMSGTYWTDNGGFTWNAHSTFMPQPTLCSMILQVPDDGSTAVCLDYTNELWIYDWNTLSWVNHYTITNSTQSISISFDAGSPPTLYISNAGSGMVFTKNLGQSFVTFNSGLPAGGAGFVSADPAIPGLIIVSMGPDLYQCTSGPKSAGSESRTLESNGRAKVWFPYGTGLPGTNILSLIHDPIHPKLMYAGTLDNGVYVSYDRGAHWHPITLEGMQHRSIVDVAVNPEDPNTLYACGHSGGPTEGGFYKITIPYVFSK